MAENEAKHRKLNVTGHVQASDDSEDLESQVDSSKVRGKSTHIRRVIEQRKKDIIGCTFFWIKFVMGYIIMVTELQPLDSNLTCFLLVVGYILMLLFLASWCATLYHGPGRPCEAPDLKGLEIPPALAAAFSAGKNRRSGPQFDGKEDWCSKCNSYKPALASHCKICNQCCFFMDHHCTLIGMCVGFKNLRGFIVCLCYGQAIHYYLTLCILLQICNAGLPQSLWQRGQMAACVVYICQGWYLVRSQLTYLLRPYYSGWRSRVIMEKFCSLARDVTKVLEQASHGSPAFKELSTANEALKLKEFKGAPQASVLFSQAYRSPFAEKSSYFGHLELVFGEALSWRWLLPFRPGGSGAVLSPECNTSACEAWAALGAALGRAEVAVEEERAEAKRKAEAEAAHLEALTALAQGMDRA